MKLVVAGSRGIQDRGLVYGVLDKLADEFFISEIVSGECKPRKGEKTTVDQLAKEWAEDRGYSYCGFPADWNKYGMAAGPKRNIKQGRYGDMLVAFWDGHSLGTRGMIREMQVHDKPWILVPVGWGYDYEPKRPKKADSIFARFRRH
jgi:hypothetical protein